MNPLRDAAMTLGAALTMGLETIIGAPPRHHSFSPAHRPEGSIGCYGPFDAESTCAWAMSLYPYPTEGHWYDDGAGHLPRGWWFAGHH
jgi:hypothetical protein